MEHLENQIFEESADQDDELNETGIVIKSAVNIHDRSQVEFIFDYNFEGRGKTPAPNIPKGEEAEEKKPPLYEVEAYFFFPPQMGISSNLYTKRQFYDDIRPLFRLREPRFGFKDFISPKKPSDSTPIQRLETLLAKSEKDPLSQKDADACIFQTRLFACTFSNFFMRRVNRRTRKIDRFFEGNDHSDVVNCKKLITRCEVLVEKALSLVEKWEGVVTAFSKAKFVNPLLQEQVVQEMLLVDEFCHYKLSEGVARMASHCREADLIKRGMVDEAHKLQRSLMIWSRWHYRQCRKKGYLAIDDNSSIVEQERYFFRRGDLKKRMWQVLYLDLEPRKSLELQKQIAYMIAAGIAASWAFFAQVLISYQLNFSGSASNIESLLNASGLAILIAFIGAYVLKDRIKDIGREWFKSGLFGKSPDFSYRVWFNNLGRDRFCIGNIVESTEFCVGEKVPEGILEKRKELPGHLVSFNEKVVHYHQKLDLSQMEDVTYLGPIWAVRSIFRFNLRRYLDYLDDSIQKHSVLNRRGEVCVISFPKVYHLDVILRYAYTDASGKRSYVGFDCNRLIVDKEGLIRVENPY